MTTIAAAPRHLIIHVERCRNCRTVQLNGLMIDVTHRTVTAGERSAHLRPSEMTILARMVERRGQPVKREQLIFELYGNDPNGGPLNPANTISVFIFHLRRKLRSIRAPFGIEMSGYNVGWALVPVDGAAHA